MKNLSYLVLWLLVGAFLIRRIVIGIPPEEIIQSNAINQVLVSLYANLLRDDKNATEIITEIPPHA
jgi:hypothetical protein